MKLIPSLFVLIFGLWATSETQGNPSCSSPGYFADPSDCSRFYRCADHSTDEGHALVRYDFNCPHETVFDTSIDVCVFPSGHGCPGGWGPSQGWSPPPTKGWSPSPKPKGWSPPVKGWSAPVKAWSAPPTKGWSPPPKPKGWSAPSKGWSPPVPKGWSPPAKGWSPPLKPKGWSPPSKGWSAPLKAWSPPSSGWDSGEVSAEGSEHFGLTPGSSYIIVYEDERQQRGESGEDF